MRGTRVRTTNRVRLGLVAALSVVTLVLTGCSLGSGSDDLAIGEAEASAVPTAEPAPTATTRAVTCTDPLASYAPDASSGTVTAGSTMAAIRDRGYLLVGVSADTLLMGARNPLSGNIEGFDIDVLHQVAQAILGDPDAIQYRVITSAQRLPSLQGDDPVDIVARTMTMTCDRWQSIDFSTEYYHAGQKLLVASDSDATSLADLAGERVCAPASTTTYDRIADSGVEAVAAETHTQCLVRFQQGDVVAIAGDDTILAGFAAQDPYAKVVGDAISDEPYGLGMQQGQEDLVRFVNQVLEDMRTDGRWEQIYTKWLGGLGDATPPAAVYGR
jgi:polar amino acid transport system substrate-binding protein